LAILGLVPIASGGDSGCAAQKPLHVLRIAEVLRRLGRTEAGSLAPT
jgi:hypothetical protein